MTGPVLKGTSTATENPNKLWKPATKVLNHLWPQENWTVTMELKGDQALAGTYQAEVPVISDFTTIGLCLILVAPTTMCMFQN